MKNLSTQKIKRDSFMTECEILIFQPIGENVVLKFDKNKHYKTKT